MYDRVLVITTNSYYSKVPSTGTPTVYLFFLIAKTIVNK